MEEDCRRCQQWCPYDLDGCGTQVTGNKKVQSFGLFATNVNFRQIWPMADSTKYCQLIIIILNPCSTGIKRFGTISCRTPLPLPWGDEHYTPQLGTALTLSEAKGTLWGVPCWGQYLTDVSNYKPYLKQFSTITYSTLIKASVSGWYNIITMSFCSQQPDCSTTSPTLELQAIQLTELST